jgi:hypothetical protein
MKATSDIRIAVPAPDLNEFAGMVQTLGGSDCSEAAAIVVEWATKT